MYLAIDIGNTFIKIALSENGKLINQDFFRQEVFKEKMIQISKSFDIESAIISSVGKLSETDKEFVLGLFDCFILNQNAIVPFDNKYETPHTLGVDRMALVAAGVNNYPSENVLIIDAGTCITYDFLNDRKEYLGGAISLGVQSRYKALNNFTANLPLLEEKIPNGLIGRNTEQSIHSGVVNGVISEIDGIITQYSNSFEKLTVVLTGGDAPFLANQLKSSIFVRPFFLLDGLFTILKLNTNDKKN